MTDRYDLIMVDLSKEQTCFQSPAVNVAMEEVGAYEAKKQCVNPAAQVDQQQVAKIIERLRQLRKDNRLAGLSVRQLIDEGRRF